MTKKYLFEDSPVKRNQSPHLDSFFSLLAAENLRVVRANVSTASIRLDTRTITIPNFSTENKDLFLTFGSHEVSHALHTPVQWCHDEVGKKIKNSRLRRCINVVEDIRIERLIRRKFPGFVKVYERGYKELLTKHKFFSLDHWDSFDIVDKINSKAKLGSQLTKTMTPYEAAVYARVVKNLNSFNDTLVAAYFLLNLLDKDKNKKKPKPKTPPKQETPEEDVTEGEMEIIEEDDVESEDGSEPSDETDEESELEIPTEPNPEAEVDESESEEIDEAMEKAKKQAAAAQSPENLPEAQDDVVDDDSDLDRALDNAMDSMVEADQVDVVTTKTYGSSVIASAPWVKSGAQTKQSINWSSYS